MHIINFIIHVYNYVLYCICTVCTRLFAVVYSLLVFMLRIVLCTEIFIATIATVIGIFIWTDCLRLFVVVNKLILLKGLAF